MRPGSARVSSGEALGDGRTNPPERGGSPSLAVIVPARNESARIGACLTSVGQALRQAQLSAEIIVVDDDSNDRTGRVAREAGATVLTQRPRQGPLAAWMLGAISTSAEVLILVDADCQVDPASFSVLLSGFARPEVGVVAARSQPLEVVSGKGLVRRSAIFSALLLHRVKSRLHDHDFLPIGRLMAVRRAAWKVQDPGLTPCDRAVAHLARESGWGIAYAPAALVYYTPVRTYQALREDYRRTRVPGSALPLAYDRLAPGAVTKAATGAALSSPLNAMAWAACRTALVLQRRVRRSPTSLSSWPP